MEYLYCAIAPVCPEWLDEGSTTAIVVQSTERVQEAWIVWHPLVS